MNAFWEVEDGVVACVSEMVLLEWEETEMRRRVLASRV